ncbi:MAG: MoxR family ATPase [Candidatus Tectomicrobia bacterium]|nr:MoxR family ATPase [Candidatus Tectomicrobia bacterium]
MDIAELARISHQIIEEMGQAIVGKSDVLRQVLIGVLSDGHILFEDYPGLAKTMIARMLAQVAAINFRRIQFTPDLLPSDITGSFTYNQREGEFEFKPGPIFTNLLLADEINRTPPKTQAALLEVMQEKQATIEGVTYQMEQPFITIATQNPIEYEGTYPLPEAQLDRFIMKLSVGYLKPEEELEMLFRRQHRKSDTIQLSKVIDGKTLVEMQKSVEQVYVSEEIERYIVDIVAETRRDSRVQVGASPRGTLALFKLSRSCAAIQGRDFVTPDDVKAMAIVGLSHRLILMPELWVSRINEREIIREILNKVPTPKA